ncbi:hypothetical protein EVAR_55887_1 [Eumeta japonica]|uniref:Uncharacterized protein n=1 Tax=Eumeta variegata TaxID=151549 RepID=A0A4C1YKN6_EUMVA|nr:hypothetical protein EVAR_55887_1 [Eumeta japonica]
MGERLPAHPAPPAPSTHKKCGRRAGPLVIFESDGRYRPGRTLGYLDESIGIDTGYIRLKSYRVRDDSYDESSVRYRVASDLMERQSVAAVSKRAFNSPNAPAAAPTLRNSRSSRIPRRRSTSL